MLFGDPTRKILADAVQVRYLGNFHWTFITLLAVVFYVYLTEIKNRNYKAVLAGVSLYAVHWFYEIINAVIAHVSGYALWTVSNESTSLVLLIGVSWELSMMFSVAGIIAFKHLPEDRDRRLFVGAGRKGISSKMVVALAMALLFSVVEIFLAATPAFIWVYRWWGAVPVFITTYIPFFLAACYVPDAGPRFQKGFIGSLVTLDALLLIILVPLGII